MACNWNPFQKSVTNSASWKFKALAAHQINGELISFAGEFPCSVETHSVRRLSSCRADSARTSLAASRFAITWSGSLAKSAIIRFSSIAMALSSSTANVPNSSSKLRRSSLFCGSPERWTGKANPVGRFPVAACFAAHSGFRFREGWGEPCITFAGVALDSVVVGSPHLDLYRLLIITLDKLYIWRVTKTYR